MGLFNKKKTAKKDATNAEQQQQQAVAQPDIFGVENTIVCNVRDSWEWVIDEIRGDMSNLSVVENPEELPTAVKSKQNNNGGEGTTSPPTEQQQKLHRRLKSGRFKKAPGPCSLKMEIQNVATGQIIDAVHGTSEAFDGLEDKDELVRTMQRCRCENLEISPPSRLFTWDVTKEECNNLVGDSLPSLTSLSSPSSKTKKNKSSSGEKQQQQHQVAVLKDPMGSSGTGVFFVTNAQEIHEIIEEHRKRAVEDPDFLNNLIAAKGRIPSWVLQAEIIPCLLIRGRRKFHIRSYVVCVENIYEEEIIQTFVYNRHEIRIAGEDVPENETAADNDSSNHRDRTAHITNGANSNNTQRDLLSNEPELVKRNLQKKVELFVAQIFDKHFVNDLARRVSMSISEDAAPARKFVVGGLDVMVTEDNRLYLLEVNVNPAAPARSTVNEEFQNHLASFMWDLMNLVEGKIVPSFLSCSSILDAQQQQGES